MNKAIAAQYATDWFEDLQEEQDLQISTRIELLHETLDAIVWPIEDRAGYAVKITYRGGEAATLRVRWDDAFATKIIRIPWILNAMRAQWNAASTRIVGVPGGYVHV